MKVNLKRQRIKTWLKLHENARIILKVGKYSLYLLIILIRYTYDL